MDIIGCGLKSKTDSYSFNLNQLVLIPVKHCLINVFADVVSFLNYILR